jgi:hypothetical protein
MRHEIALGLDKQAEVERIHTKLAQFLPGGEAREIAMQVYDLALDVDEDIDKILKDPLAGRLYEYDGKFFTPRGTQNFHTTFDGLHILKSLGDSKIDTFFKGRKKGFAVRWLLDELQKHSWVAKRRRMNWEESHTLGLLTNEVIQEILKLHGRGSQTAGTSALSPEEQAFFKYFEDEMGTLGSRTPAP